MYGKTIEYMAIETLHRELIDALGATNHVEALAEIRKLRAQLDQAIETLGIVMTAFGELYGSNGPHDPMPYDRLTEDRKQELDRALQAVGATLDRIEYE